MLIFYARLAEKIGNEMNDSHEYVMKCEYGALYGYDLDPLLRPIRVEGVSQRQYTQRYKVELRKVYSLSLMLKIFPSLILALESAISS